MVECTFKPDTLKTSRNTIQSHRSTGFAKRGDTKQIEQARKAKEEKDLKEMEECTFIP